MPENMTGITVDVCSPKFGAMGDGTSDDRAAIQAAVDYASEQGGGRVVLTEGRTFLTSLVVMKSGVELHFGDGAVLKQAESDALYVKPVTGGYEPYVPFHGHNYSSSLKWSHAWYANYPLIYAMPGTRDFSVTGRGEIRMMPFTDFGSIIKICPFGFFDCGDFEISGITVNGYNSYAMLLISCSGVLISGITVKGFTGGNTDGICLMNCSHVRVTGCTLDTGDDSLYIFSSYRDPRKGEWWSSDSPSPSEDFEIDHNSMRSEYCKGFGLIPWGNECPDPELVEIRDVYVHDNHIEAMGVWLSCPFSRRGWDPPITHVRFENNRIDGIERSFFCTQIADMTGFRSMTLMKNGDFRQGRCFWSLQGDAGIVRDTGDGGDPYAYISSLDSTDSAVYQGLYFRKDSPAAFRAVTSVKSHGSCVLFVKRSDTGETVASLPVSGEEWQENVLHFSVPEDGNYRVGLGRGDARDGDARMRGAFLVNHEAAEGHVSAEIIRGMAYFKYSDDLFRRP